MTKHYRLAQAGQATRPFFIFEVKIDQRDVRSGIHRSDFGLFEGDWIIDPSLNWTEDMVRRLDNVLLEEIEEKEGADLPPFLDEKIIHYFTRNYYTPLHRNYLLGLYSRVRESREDFINRCEESLLDERNRMFLKDKEVFVHRFLDLEQKQLQRLEQEELEHTIHHWRSAQIQQIFAQVHEALDRCAMHTDFKLEFLDDLHWTARLHPDGQDRLQDLWQEFKQRYRAINEDLRERARSIEPYSAPLSHSQVEVVSKGVLWK